MSYQKKIMMVQDYEQIKSTFTFYNITNYTFDSSVYA